MRKIDLLQLIERNINEYRLEANASLRRNGHMNDYIMDGKEDIPQGVIDALLVDFLNYVRVFQGVDYGMYTKDLKKLIKMENNKIDLPSAEEENKNDSFR